MSTDVERQPVRDEAEGDDLYECTIVIPCRNEAAAIRPFMESLLVQERSEGTWEILVADGESDDGTREILEEYSTELPEIRIVSNPERIVSPGLNRAIRAARGTYVVRMDVHTVYAPDYVRRCLDVIRDTGAMNVGGAARTRAEGLVPEAIAAAYASPIAVGGARFHFPSYRGPVDTVTYGCWRRRDLMALGLFDEALVRNQDDELNLRIRRAGGVVWQDPSIKSWYSPRGSIGKLFKQYFQYGFWKVAVIRKHKQPASWRHLVPAAFVASVVTLSVAGILFRPAWLMLVGILALYLAFVLVGSVWIAARAGWKLLPILPIVIATFHVSYGSGFLQAMLRLPRRSGSVEELSR